MAARDVKKVASVIAESPYAQQVRLVKKIVTDEKTALTAEDKIKLILDLALKTPDAQHQKKLLQLLLENHKLTIAIPPFYVAASGSYQSIIPALKSWLADDPETLKTWLYNGLQYAIMENKSKPFSMLLAQAPELDQNNLTQLAWEVVKQKKDRAFIEELAQKGHRSE